MMNLLKAALRILLGRGSVRSYSQFGEDAVLEAMFRGQKKGMYVDVGAYHPVLYSNTYALYRRGWKGIVIDPNEQMGMLFKVFRRRDRFVHAAAGKEAGTATYYRYKDPAYNSLSTEQVEALRNKKGISPVGQREVRVEPLNDILSSAGVTTIDILSIDVEGMDLMVLASHDWAIRPRVVVEDHAFDPLKPESSEVSRFLIEKGYRLKGYAGLSLIFRDSVS